MSSYNHVTLVGNLKDDPTFKAGKNPKATFILAVEHFRGAGKEPAIDYVNIVACGKLAKATREYLRAGKKALIDGRLQIRSEKKDGEKVWITEVVAENIKFLSSWPKYEAVGKNEIFVKELEQ